MVESQESTRPGDVILHSQEGRLLILHLAIFQIDKMVSEPSSDYEKPYLGRYEKLQSDFSERNVKYHQPW